MEARHLLAIGVFCVRSNRGDLGTTILRGLARPRLRTAKTAFGATRATSVSLVREARESGFGLGSEQRWKLLRGGEQAGERVFRLAALKLDKERLEEAADQETIVERERRNLSSAVAHFPDALREQRSEPGGVGCGGELGKGLQRRFPSAVGEQTFAREKYDQRVVRPGPHREGELAIHLLPVPLLGVAVREEGVDGGEQLPALFGVAG